MTALVLLCLPLAAPYAAEPPPAKPQRVVSLNICTDELLLRMVQPGRIASVTWLSRDPATSNVAPLAAKVPINYGLAEEVVPLHPDLVLGGTYTTRTAVAMLRRAGIPLAEFGVPGSIDEVRAQIREAAKLLREPEAGERMVAEIDAPLRKLRGEPPAVRPKAIVLSPNGFTVGPGTLVDEIISTAGLDNIAARLGIDSYGQIPLETVIANAIDILIVSASGDGPPALATEILRHPVLAKLGGRTRIVFVPSRLWNCPGPEIITAIERLKRAGDEVRRERTGS